MNCPTYSHESCADVDTLHDRLKAGCHREDDRCCCLCADQYKTGSWCPAGCRTAERGIDAQVAAYLDDQVHEHTLWDESDEARDRAMERREATL